MKREKKLKHWIQFMDGLNKSSPFRKRLGEKFNINCTSF
jgi:hypothetical protein